MSDNPPKDAPTQEDDDSLESEGMREVADDPLAPHAMLDEEDYEEPAPELARQSIDYVLKQDDRRITWEESDPVRLGVYVMIALVIGIFMVLAATPVGSGIVSGAGKLIDELFELGQAKVVSLQGPRSGLLKPGETLVLAAVFAREVRVDGAPELWLDVGGETERMAYKGQQSPGRLRFEWTPSRRDIDLDGIGWPDQIKLNGAKITGMKGRDALTRLPGGSATNYRMWIGNPQLMTLHENGGLGHVLADEMQVTYRKIRLPEDARITDLVMRPAGQSGFIPPDIWVSSANGQMLHSSDGINFELKGRSDIPLTAVLPPDGNGPAIGGGAGRLLSISGPDYGKVETITMQGIGNIKGMARGPRGIIVAVTEQGGWLRQRPGALVPEKIGEIGRPGFADIVHHAGAFHAISGRMIRESADGTAWVPSQVSPDLRGQLRYITAADGLMAVSSQADEVLIRPDGAPQWRMLPRLPNGGRITAIAALRGLRVMVATREPAALYELSASHFADGWQVIDMPADAPPITAMAAFDP